MVECTLISSQCFQWKPPLESIYVSQWHTQRNELVRNGLKGSVEKNTMNYELITLNDAAIFSMYIYFRPILFYFPQHISKQYITFVGICLVCL